MSLWFEVHSQETPENCIKQKNVTEWEDSSDDDSCFSDGFFT